MDHLKNRSNSLFAKFTNSTGSSPVNERHESSAKREKNICLEMVGRSLMNNKNKTGPNTLPCGTPVVIVDLDELL